MSQVWRSSLPGLKSGSSGGGSSACTDRSNTSSVNNAGTNENRVWPATSSRRRSLLDRHLQPQVKRSSQSGLRLPSVPRGHAGTKPSVHVLQQQLGLVISSVAAVQCSSMRNGGGHCNDNGQEAGAQNSTFATTTVKATTDRLVDPPTPSRCAKPHKTCAPRNSRMRRCRSSR